MTNQQTLYAHWEQNIVVIFNDFIRYGTATGNKELWTNNTGYPVTVYYTLDCTNGSYGSSYTRLQYSPGTTVFAQADLGDSVSGSYSIPDGKTIYFNEYFAEGNVYLYYCK